MKLGECKTLMVQGTTSDAGKSTLVTALGRMLARQGYAVAPFKPQNMALNSAVSADGGEIGRAQAVQAQACGLAPNVHMNPVLIKPASDTTAQIIIQGKACAVMNARNYHAYKPVAQAAVLDSYNQLSKQYACVLVEGAGSPAEINLREGDIANMGFAEAVDCPVILVADIDKGGVFAHIVGTLALLSETERARIIGFVINRFRGDIALLQSGLDWLEQQTGKPVLAVLPFLQDFYLQAEDGISTHQIKNDTQLNVVVPVLPRISNHTDFDSLRLHPKVNLTFVSPRQPPPACDLIILPGSKAVSDDLALLKQAGWGAALKRHLRYGGKVLGICGGYQMLGKTLYDPKALEGATTLTEGFNLLPVATTYEPHKVLTALNGTLRLCNREASVSGYEIHHGQTELLAPQMLRPVLFDSGSEEGCQSDDGTVLGSYCHGLLDTAESFELILTWAGLTGAAGQDVQQLLDTQIERLADTLVEYLDQHKLQQALAQFAATRQNLEPPLHVV